MLRSRTQGIQVPKNYTYQNLTGIKESRRQQSWLEYEEQVGRSGMRERLKINDPTNYVAVDMTGGKGIDAKEGNI